MKEKEILNFQIFRSEEGGMYGSMLFAVFRELEESR